ncbi:MAG: (Fe-S)-binding protein [Desulfobacter sp.]
MIPCHGLEPDLSRCNRCGFCQDVCPTYAVSRNELDVARGRLRALGQVARGQCAPSVAPELLVQADQCLLCGACSANCPSGVPTEDIIQKARTGMLAQQGFSLFHSLVYRGVLDRRERLEKITALIRLLDRTSLRNRVARSAAMAALPVIARAATALPEQLDIPARKQLGSGYEGVPGREPICYFMGCGTNVFTPDAGLALVRCLETAGFEVAIPRVPCCGGPHFSAGDMAKARRLARENIGIITRLSPKAVVTDCATCAHTLHSYAGFFDADDPIQEKIRALAEKVVDIHQFLIDHLHTNAFQSGLAPGRKTVVTYHDPCHAVRGMQVSQSPRALLAAIPGIQFREMEGADTCCGGAGSYAFRHPGMSQAVLDRKIDAIVRTRAAVVSTSCPSCVLQISAGLRRRRLNIRVAHPITLAAQALGNKRPGKKNNTRRPR